MNEGRTILLQLISFLPDREFRRCVERNRGDSRLRGLSRWEQFLAMAFAQLTYRDSLRSIEASIPRQVAQVLDGRRRHEAPLEQAVLQQISNPLAILGIGLASTALMCCGFTSICSNWPSSTAHTGRQYTPVASIATCVTPCSFNQSASSSKAPVNVPKVRVC
jgi:hypothetical protein